MAVNLPYGNLSDQILAFSHKTEPELPFQPAIDGIDTSNNPLKFLGWLLGNFLFNFNYRIIAVWWAANQK